MVDKLQLFVVNDSNYTSFERWRWPMNRLLVPKMMQNTLR